MAHNIVLREPDETPQPPVDDGPKDNWGGWRSEVDRLGAEDGEIIIRLRTLQAAHQAGEISAMEFERAYRALDRSVGRPCDRCGTPPATLKRGRAIYCGRCYQETA